MSAVSRVIALVALTVVSVGLVACGGASNDTATSSGGSSAGGNDGVQFDGVTLSYVGFGGILDDQIKKVWMDPFTSQTGAKFTLDSPTDYSKLQTQVQTNNVSYDLVDGDQFFINPQCGKLFEQLNVPQTSVLPDLKATSNCGVADYVYGIGMYYDKSKFPSGGPQSCADFFDTKRFPGKRVIWTYSAAAGSLECAAIAAGADPKNPYPIDLPKALAKLKSLKGSLSTFDSGSQVVDGMVNGDAAIYMATTRNYVDAVDKGAKYGFASQFAGRGAGALAIPKGAPHKAAAEAWLKYIMNQAINRKISTGAPPYTSVTGGAVPADWPAAAKAVDVVSGPLSKVAFTVDQKWWADNYDAVSKRYGGLLAG